LRNIQNRKEKYYANNLEEVDALLKIGAGKASAVANDVLSKYERIRL
jgi:tryptophanyl-tRNA synthetase